MNILAALKVLGNPDVLLPIIISIATTHIHKLLVFYIQVWNNI